ncbi:hypothetical protein NLG97_g10074 [Lecanicillium saksenae]|uniref:Uncharacterized protein n=1 Tax=Lecanicillium saksenae TaxID=468837 RepID=A0ACC1QEE8_9HYPO|nr:hypothetical protein NLG97_g10074 [Lecanicillium saksenae]
MKAVAALTLLSAVAQASLTETVNGVTYTVTYRDADGSELPVLPGPKIDGEARRAAREQRRIQKRSQTEDNWCGYANRSPPNGTFNLVTGSWTVPTVSLRKGQTNADTPSIVQWVGIDGDGCTKGGLIQGGSGSKVRLPLRRGLTRSRSSSY